jgi:hypothetical protein
MRLLYLINRKEILPVMWERLPNPLKHEGWLWELTLKKLKEIYNINGWPAIHLEKQLPSDVQ